MLLVLAKSISVTDQQDSWIKAQIETGHYGNESEVFRELIRERVTRDAEIMSIRAELIEGEQSGKSDKTIDQIWAEAEQRHRSKHA